MNIITVAIAKAATTATSAKLFSIVIRPVTTTGLARTAIPKQHVKSFANAALWFQRDQRADMSFRKLATTG